MTMKRYTDWQGWWIGLRQNLMKCIGTTGTAWLGSNGIAATGIPGTAHIGLDWRQAVGLFAVHIGAEVFMYLKNNQPTVTEVDTQMISKPNPPAPPAQPKQTP